MSGPHRWKKGMPSPNPLGRPRTGLALAEAVRAGCDPAELVEIAVKLARTGTPTEQLAALAWLRDSGYQRPAERHEVVSVNVSEIDAERVLAKLSTEALRELTTAAEQTGGDDESE